jgi:hypothetical protein
MWESEQFGAVHERGRGQRHAVRHRACGQQGKSLRASRAGWVVSAAMLMTW